MNYNVKLNDLNEMIEKNKYVFVIFSVEWCGECKMMELVFPVIASDPEFSEVKFAKIDIDEEYLWDGEKNSEKYNILQAPTTIIYKNGQELKRVTNFVPREKYKELAIELIS